MASPPDNSHGVAQQARRPALRSLDSGAHFRVYPSSVANQGIQIGRASQQTGLSVDAIRFYEKQRLLERPPRTEGGFRLFTPEHIQRIQLIRRAQQLGFSLSEIRELLVLQHGDGETCSHVRDLLRAKVAAVRGKLRELEILEQQLRKSLRKCERKLKASGDSHAGRCPVLEDIAHRGPDED